MSVNHGLYLCEDGLLRSQLAAALDEASGFDVQADTLVYKSEGGRTGLDSDDAGLGLLAWMLADGLIWDDDDSTFIRINCPSDRLAPYLRARIKPVATTVHSPDPWISSQFEQGATHANRAKISRLRSRYFLPKDPPCDPPLLSGFRAEDFEKKLELISLIVRHCDRMMIWRISDFGLHARALAPHPGFRTALEQRCFESGVPFNVVVAATALPVW